MRRRSSAGVPASSSTTVALAAGDHRLVSDRPAALRDDSEDGRPRDDGADGALAVHCVVQDQRLRAWPAPAGGDPAYERDPFVRLVQARQKRPGREREGIDEQRDEPGVVELGKSRHRDPILRLHGRGVEALDLRSRQRTRPDGHRRTMLELADTGDHSLGDAAEQVPRRELLTDGLGGRLHLVQMCRREEQEREVDRVLAAPAAARRTRRRRSGLPDRLRSRQTSPDPTRKRLGLHCAIQSTPAKMPRPKRRRCGQTSEGRRSSSHFSWLGAAISTRLVIPELLPQWGPVGLAPFPSVFLTLCRPSTRRSISSGIV